MADATLYYRTAEGSLVSRVVTGGGEPALPDGATALTEEEYLAALADVEAARQAHADELVAADEANQLADYQALRASGIPEATARRLTGYDGPDVEN
ncbi:hypothetical protein ACPCSG_26960 [Streptomyces cellulosae]